MIIHKVMGLFRRKARTQPSIIGVSIIIPGKITKGWGKIEHDSSLYMFIPNPQSKEKEKIDASQ